MKRYYRILLLMICLMPVLASAQSNYKPGYVVTLKGDTLKGFVDYREWNISPSAIDFKKSMGDKEGQKYGTSAISYFSIDKLDAFQRYSGPITTDNVNDVSGDRDTSFRMDTVFLRVIEKGSKVALYSYRDKIKIRYFIADNPDYQPRELIFRVTRDGSENTFRKQLSASAARFNDLSNDMITQIGRAEYTQDDLLGIAGKINNISKSDYVKNHYNGDSFNFFVGVGVNITTTTPASFSSYYAAGGRAYTSFLPAVMFGANFFANPATRQLQFRIELSAAQSKYADHYQSTVSPYIAMQASYDELTLAISPQVIYNVYNAENFKVFIGGGIQLSHYIFSNSHVDGSIDESYVFNTNDNNFILKAGFQFSRNLAIVYDWQNNVAATQGGYFRLSSSCQRVSLNYFFR